MDESRSMVGSRLPRLFSLTTAAAVLSAFVIFFATPISAASSVTLQARNASTGTAPARYNNSWLDIHRGDQVDLIWTTTQVRDGSCVGNFTSAILPNNGTLRVTPSSYEQNYTVTCLGSDDGKPYGDQALVRIIDDSTPTSPSITSMGVLNAANAQFPDQVAPGSWWTVYGSGFTSGGSCAAGAYPLPTDFCGIRGYLNGVPLALQYVSSSQVNFLVPEGLVPETNADLWFVRTANGVDYTSNRRTLVVHQTLPGLFQVNGAVLASNGSNLAQLVSGPGSVPLPIYPQSATSAGGNVVVFWGTGFNPLDRRIGYGNAAPTNGPLTQCTTPPKFYMDGNPMAVLFCGLAPGFAGLWQINVAVPANTADGAHRFSYTYVAGPAQSVLAGSEFISITTKQTNGGGRF